MTGQPKPYDGHTRLFGVIADPIEHVRAPEVFNAAFAEKGIDAVLVPFHVTAAELPLTWEGFRRLRNLDGFAVTIPHKHAVMALSDDIGRQAALVGAANVVRREPDGRMRCENFDGQGFVAGLRAQGFPPDGRRILLLGAGGAGKAIAFALADAGIAGLTIANRTHSAAEDLAAKVAAAVPGLAVDAGPADPRGFDMVVNATSLGLRPDDPLPLELDGLASGTVVAEIIMKPETTPLLEAAMARGCPVHYGRHMLDEQVRLLGAFMGAWPG